MGPDLDLDAAITLSRHAALKIRGSQQILVLPERAIRLRGSSAEILRLCEGTCTGEELLATMRARYPDDPKIDQQVVAFLIDMLARGALEWVLPNSPRCPAERRGKR